MTPAVSLLHIRIPTTYSHAIADAQLDLTNGNGFTCLKRKEM